MSDYLSYNSSAMDDAIVCSKNAAATYEGIISTINKINANNAPMLNNNMPNLMNNIANTADSLTGITYGLNRIKLLAEKAGVIDGFSSLDEYMKFVTYLSDNAGEKAIFIDSDYAQALNLPYTGYISIPSGYNMFSSYPLIVALTGMNMDSPNSVIGVGLCAAAYNNPDSVNAIVYMPTDWQSGNRYDISKIHESVDKVATMVGADKNRISIVGHSLGGFAVLDVVANNPGYYAAAVEDGACCWTYHSDGTYDATIKKIAQSGTVLIKVESTEDYDCGVSEYMEKDYNAIKTAGGKIVLYQVQGGDHNTSARCQNQVMMNDIANINKNMTYNLPSEKIVVKDQYLLEREYIEHKENYMGKATTSKWYQKITDGEYVISPRTETPEQVVPNTTPDTNPGSADNGQTDPTSGNSNGYSGGYSGGSSGGGNTPKEVKKTYTLTIKYVYAHNPSYIVYTETKTINAGDAYNYTPRVALYYNATPGYITGVMPENNFEVLITYVPVNDINGNGRADEEENLGQNKVEEIKETIGNNTGTTTVNNYYYGSSTKETNVNKDLTDLEIEPTENIEPVEIIEPVIEEPIVEPEPVEIIPEIHPHADPNLVVNTNNNTNIWPVVGLAAGVTGAVVGAKVLLDKDKKEDNDQTLVEYKSADDYYDDSDNY